MPMHALESTLWQDYLSSDRSTPARNALAEHYLPLAQRIAGAFCARRALPASADRGAIASDAVLGLLDAIKRFQPIRGIQFRTFATFRIRGAIVDGLRQNGQRRRMTMVRDLTACREKLTLRLGRVPSDQDLLADLGWSMATLREALCRTVSIDAARPATEDSHDPRPPEIADRNLPAPTARIESAEQFEKMISRFSPRDRQILRCYFVEGLTMQRIGRRLRMSESRISQLIAAHLRFLRKCLGGDRTGRRLAAR
jgi:RNA polymerase sigma factor for flagellar operon FliA